MVELGYEGHCLVDHDGVDTKIGKVMGWCGLRV